MDHEKIVLVTRKTRLEELVARFNTRAQAQFYIEHSGGDFAMYEREHATYHAALGTLRQRLHRLTKVQVIERGYLPSFLFADDDLVVTIGIDGLVVNTAKYLHGQALVAVNPDPDHIDGVLLPFDVDTAVATVEKALRGNMTIRPVTMAEATLNDGQKLLAFNDLFIGRHDHVSARYRIQINGHAEQHSSSGIIVSTGAGSTGWLSSMFNMAHGIMSAFGDEHVGLSPPQLEWDTQNLLFVVREPFISKTSAANIVCGAITANEPLLLESTMPDGGVIFSDGIAKDFLAFNAGAIATIGLAAQRTNLVAP
jgi:NAD kinase